jgi:glycosyltransferase involved in cell wall biosynthesis
VKAATVSQIPVSVLVQTKNEEVGIGACLESLTQFAEVIVVDSESTDRTQAIAEEHGATVVSFKWDGQYPKKKQWQLENVATLHKWVLFLDADETPSAALLESMRRVAEENPAHVAAFDVELDYTFAGRQLKHGHRVVKRAFVHRDRVTFPVFNDLDSQGMGELEGHYQPQASGKVETIVGRIEHDDKDPVRTWFDRHNRYSDWEAHLVVEPGVRASVARARSKQGAIFQRLPFKPLVFFLYSYVFRRGFLDGRPGLDYALALAFYYWQIGLKTRELLRVSESSSGQ